MIYNNYNNMTIAKHHLDMGMEGFVPKTWVSFEAWNRQPFVWFLFLSLVSCPCITAVNKLTEGSFFDLILFNSRNNCEPTVELKGKSKRLIDISGKRCIIKVNKYINLYNLHELLETTTLHYPSEYILYLGRQVEEVADS